MLTLQIHPFLGQDAAGIVTSHRGRLNMIKNVGPVSEVFTQDNIHSKFDARHYIDVLLI